jgi:hypothetical protein
MTTAVELPVRERAFPPRPHDSRTTAPASHPEPPCHARVVVADAATREICTNILRGDGYAVRTSASAEQPLERCAASWVDMLIITHGDELVRHISPPRRSLTIDGGPLLIGLAQQPSVAASVAATQAHTPTPRPSEPTSQDAPPTPEVTHWARTRDDVEGRGAECSR